MVSDGVSKISNVQFWMGIDKLIFPSKNFHNPGYLFNCTLMFDRCQRSEAVVTPAKNNVIKQI